ncbi:uncharacterized protein LOC125753653 isoform X3 [Canis lupus dingo]|uniref:uncharacterized protein LOC125753653 isoform X3 n=1 Tax=Canis lupus dingo TaxID=286419 RepID=UPI0020C22C85|nr:uncharacterized protein LOC125753653 isoform X3 [Canis lupus dingo]
MACHSPGRSGISSPLTPVGEEGIPNGTLSTSDANRPLVQRKPAFCWSEERFRRGSKNRAGFGKWCPCTPYLKQLQVAALLRLMHSPLQGSICPTLQPAVPPSVRTGEGTGWMFPLSLDILQFS